MSNFDPHTNFPDDGTTPDLILPQEQIDKMLNLEAESDSSCTEIKIRQERTALAYGTPKYWLLSLSVRQLILKRRNKLNRLLTQKLM